MKSTGLNLLYLFLFIGVVTLFTKFDKNENEIKEIQAKFDKEVNNNYCYIIEKILLFNC